MGVAGPIFYPHHSHLVRIHIFLSCKSAEIFVALPQMVLKLAKSVWSAPSISWDVLALAYCGGGHMTRGLTIINVKVPRVLNLCYEWMLVESMDSKPHEFELQGFLRTHGIHPNDTLFSYIRIICNTWKIPTILCVILSVDSHTN